MNLKDKAWLAIKTLKVSKDDNPELYTDIEKYIKELERKVEFYVVDELEPMMRWFRD